MNGYSSNGHVTHKKHFNWEKQVSQNIFVCAEKFLYSYKSLMKAKLNFKYLVLFFSEK